MYFSIIIKLVCTASKILELVPTISGNYSTLFRVSKTLNMHSMNGLINSFISLKFFHSWKDFQEVISAEEDTETKAQPKIALCIFGILLKLHLVTIRII